MTASAASLTSGGVLAATAAALQKTPVGAPLTGTGTLTATCVNAFTPITEINTPRTGATIPTGTSGVWVTLVGAGGAGGSGRKATNTSSGGGGGGGGGYIPRTFIPISAFAGQTTYALSMPTSGPAGGAAQATASTDGNAGTASSAVQFSDGASAVVIVLADCGAPGAGGTTTTVAGGRVALLHVRYRCHFYRC